MNFVFRTYRTLSHARRFWVALIVAVLAVGLIAPEAAHALIGADEAIAVAAGWVLQLVLYVFGTLFAIAVALLLKTAQYNTFLDHQAVQIGWAAVRDLSNMFFIVILLVIAFGTILRSQAYGYRSLLSKFVLMAILINFSDTITGFFIDMSQIVFLTFVDAFVENAARLLTLENALGLGAIVKLGGIEKSFQELVGKNVIGLQDVLLTGVMGILFLAIATGVIMGLGIMLLARVVALWILIILSPIPYLASLLPSTQKYASQWWSTLGKYLFNAPVLGFFLWLTFTIIARSAAEIDATAEVISGAQNVANATGDIPIWPAEFGTINQVTNYLVVIALLIGGAKIAQTVGGMGSQFAANFADKAPKLLGKGVKEIGDQWGTRRAARTGKVGALGLMTSSSLRARAIEGYKTARTAALKKRLGEAGAKGEARSRELVNSRFFGGTRAVLNMGTHGAPEFWSRYAKNPFAAPFTLAGRSITGRMPSGRKVRESNQDAENADAAAETLEQEQRANTTRINEAGVRLGNATEQRDALNDTLTGGGISFTPDTYGKAQLLRNMMRDRMARNDDKVKKLGVEKDKARDPAVIAGFQASIDELNTENASYRTTHGALLDMTDEASFTANQASISGVFNATPGEQERAWSTEMIRERDAQDRTIATEDPIAATTPWTADEIRVQQARIREQRDISQAARARAERYKLPVTSHSDREYDQAEKGEMEPFQNPMDASGFASALAGAIERGNRVLATGLLKKAAGDKEFTGVLKRMGFGTTAEEMERFRTQVLMTRLHMNGQQSMKVMSQVGAVSAEKGSYAGSNLYALRQSGEYEPLRPEETASMTAQMMANKDGAAKIFSGPNSSALGAETTDGRFGLKLEGEVFITNNQPELLRQLKEEKINPQLLADLDRAMVDLERMMRHGYLSRQVVNEIQKQALRRRGETRYDVDSARRMI